MYVCACLDVHARSHGPRTFTFGLSFPSYTIMAEASRWGRLVARPVLIDFPLDKETYNLDQTRGQFLLGRALMVTPVLHPSHTHVDMYLPNEDWFLFSTGARLTTFTSDFIDAKGYPHPVNKGTDVRHPAPMGAALPVAVRGGAVLPLSTDTAATTTHNILHAPFQLLVALSNNNRTVITGHIYADSGDSIDPIKQGACNWWNVTVVRTDLPGDARPVWQLTIVHDTIGALAPFASLASLRVYGLPAAVASVWLDGDESNNAMSFVATGVLAPTGNSFNMDVNISLALPRNGAKSRTISWSTQPPPTLALWIIIAASAVGVVILGVMGWVMINIRRRNAAKAKQAVQDAAAAAAIDPARQSGGQIAQLGSPLLAKGARGGSPRGSSSSTGAYQPL